MVKDKVDYKDPKLQSGIEAPDTFVTVGTTDKYKLLEALNIDWKKINIPWAQSITKWNSANVDPKGYDYIGGVRAYKDAIDKSEFNNINNMVDWLNNNYDYLTDQNSNLNKSIVDEIPQWAKDGEITDSKDIVDILNYLIWRVVSLDFFTNFWDHRNATFPKWLFVLDWDGTACDALDPYEWGNKLNDKFYILNNNINIELIPTENGITSDNILMSNEIYKNYLRQNSNLNNQLYLSIYSTSPIAIEITGKDDIIPTNKNTIELKVNNYIQGVGSRVSVEDEYYYRFKLQNFNALPAQVYGTGEYTNVSTTNQSSWLYKILANTEDYSGFDPKYAKSYAGPKGLAVSFLQRGGADPNSSKVFTDLADKMLTLSVTKTDNKIKGLVFGSSVVFATEPAVSSNSESDVRKYIIPDNQMVSVPYYLSILPREENQYQIKFTLQYGEEYGIYPYFFMSASGVKHQMSIETEDDGLLLNPDNTFKSYKCKYGKIFVDDNGKYIYQPPEQEETGELSKNKDFEIHVLFYYNNTSRMRQLTPVHLTFKVQLNARITNRILFIGPGENAIQVCRNANPNAIGTFIGNDWVSTDEDNGNYVNDNNTDNNISYCIRTISYDEFIGSSKNIVFDSFITSFCSDDIIVEYIGYTKQRDTNSEISIINKTIRPNTDIDLTYTLDLNKTIRVGNSSNVLNNDEQQPYPKSFYECTADINKYYSVNDNIAANDNVNENYGKLHRAIDGLSKGRVEETTDLPTANTFMTSNGDIIADTGEKYAKKVVRQGTNVNKFEYTLHQSTAIYPLENGIFSGTGGILHDADHEYYYLVFKITCEAGTQVNGTTGQSISYKACIGYYFLKIVRRLEVPDLTMRPLSSEQIEYTDANNNDKSFRLMPRIPIYLNRLFTDQSQTILKQYDGIIDWCIEGYDNKGVSALVLEDTILAIKDERDGVNDVFINIYNENDKYPVINYTVQAYKANKEISFIPENNKNIKIGSSSKMTVKSFDTKDSEGTHSGAILFINKLLKANRTLSGDLNPDLPYVPVSSSFIEIKLYLNIGNSSKFTRMGRIHDQFTIPIYKRKYDFDLMYLNSNNGKYISASTTNGNDGNPYQLSSHDNTNNTTNYVLTATNQPDNYINGRIGSTLVDLYIASQEFGSGTNVALENDDKLILHLNNGIPYISLNNEIDVQENVNVSIINSNTNIDNWIIDNNGSMPVNFNYNYNVFSIAENSLRGIYVFGTNPTGNSIKTFTLKISGDNDGLYDDKTITIFITVSEIH